MDSDSSASVATEDLPPLRALKYNVHTPFQHLGPEELSRAAAALAVPVHLVLLNLDGNMNIAMSIRTAAVLGCSDVWVVGRRKYDTRPEVGAKHYVRVHKVSSLENPQAFFHEHGLQPILVEQGGTPLEEMDFRPYIRAAAAGSDGLKPCFILGTEATGIPAAWLAALGTTAPRITISQYGLLRSLNVSIAASVVLYEYFKQWRQMRQATI